MLRPPIIKHRPTPLLAEEATKRTEPVLNSDLEAEEEEEGPQHSLTYMGLSPSLLDAYKDIQYADKDK